MTPRFRAFISPARPRAQIWRSGLGLILILLIYLASLALALGAYSLLYGLERSEALIYSLGVADAPLMLLAVLASFLPIWLGLAIICPWLHKRSFSTLLGPGARVLRDFMRAALVFGLVYGLGSCVYLVAEGSLPNLAWRDWLMLLPLTLLGLLVQTGAEELLFRGYLQQQLASRFVRPFFWAVIPSVLFGLLHFDPETMGDLAPYAVVMATVFGLIAADLTAVSGSLGAAWGAHFVNNFFAMAVLSVQGSLSGLALRTTSYSLADLELTPWFLAIELLPMIFAWWLLHRWLKHG